MSDATDKAPSLPRRSKLLAVFLTLFALPAGFAYVRRLGWGIGLVFASPLLMFMAGRFGLLFTPSGYFTMLGALSLLLVVSLVLAFHFARVLPEGAAPRWYNHWYHYLWIAVLGAVFSNAVAVNRGSLFGFETYRIPSAAMRPTLIFGDFIVADTRAAATANIQRGDIVTYSPGTYPGQVWVKRVVGLPGEMVRVIGNGVEIDGKPLAESWETIRDPELTVSVPFANSTLGEDEYFLMGDNRPNSEDSRFTGPIHRSALLGKVRAIWLHFSPEHSLDTSRIDSLPPASSH